MSELREAIEILQTYEKKSPIIQDFKNRENLTTEKNALTSSSLKSLLAVCQRVKTGFEIPSILNSRSPESIKPGH